MTGLIAFATTGLMALVLPPSTPAVRVVESDREGTWAGHQIGYGWRKVPFRGRVRTRTDTFVLARVRREGDRIELRQSACKVSFEPIGGIEIRMDARHLPTDTFSFRATDSGVWSGTSEVSWGARDVDGDGNPGLTVEVISPVCSGSLFVGNRSRTRATAGFDETGTRFEGEARVRVEQTILGAQGVCLGVVARDTDERVSGPFAYVPVDADATCDSLSDRRWPARAMPPA
jgi:hypothetical protein